MIDIDASYKEGGGQIIRTALALSAITGKEFQAKNIRSGRKVSGLKAQHVHCVKALERLCNAKSRLAVIGSEYLIFTPGFIKGQTISIDIGTAGSISLLLQSLFLPSFYSKEPVRWKITGGTSGKWAMPADFMSNVLVPRISRMCEKIDIRMEKRGYFPKGGGKLDIRITPKDFSNIHDFGFSEQGTMIKIEGVSHCSKDLQGSEVAERQAKQAKLLLSRYSVPINIRSEYSDTLSTGSGISLWARFSRDDDDLDEQNPVILGSDAIGEKGKKAEDVGKEAAEKLIAEADSGAAVDQHTADNLVPFLAILGGSIRTSEITSHTETNIWICEKFLDKKFTIDKEKKIISV